jgi:hypothetical protein
VQVLKGLSPGEQVIIVGGYGVQDKTRIRVENAAAGKKDSGKAEENFEEETLKLVRCLNPSAHRQFAASALGNHSLSRDPCYRLLLQEHRLFYIFS